MRITQFGLRTLLIFISIIGVSLGWFVNNSIASRNEELLIGELELQYGGVAIIDSSTEWVCATGLTGVATRKPTSFPNRVFATLWPQTFERVTDLQLHDKSYRDDVLEIVAQLPHLKTLRLHNASIPLSKLDEFKKLNPGIAVEVLDATTDTNGSGDPFTAADSESPFGPVISGT